MSPQGPKRPKPARVHYFPKSDDAAPEPTVTSPDRPSVMSVMEEGLSEAPTEPHRIPTELGVEITPTVGAQAKPAKKKPRAPKAPRTAKKPSRGLSRARLAELSRVGHRLFKQKRYDEVQKLFEVLVQAKVQDPFPYTMLGTVFLAKKEPVKALAHFDAALHIEPHDVPALVYRGEIHFKRGNLRGAVIDLSHAIERGLEDDPFVARARKALKVIREAHRAAKKTK